MSHWSCKKLNMRGASNAPAGSAANVDSFAGDPFISVYNEQLHVAYCSSNNEVWDVWCTPLPRVPTQWNPQRIDRDGGVVPVRAGPSAGVYGDQHHFCYIRGITVFAGNDPTGIVYDAFYDGSSWHSQTIDLPPAMYENFSLIPPMSNYPFLISLWNVSDQQHFTGLCNAGDHYYGTTIMDAFYDGSSWHTQRLNNGDTGAPSAYSKPSGLLFRPTSLAGTSNPGQQHVAYRAGDGSIWDVWFDGVTGTPWKPQQLNNGGWTDAPPAAGGPTIWAVSIDAYDVYQDQLHFTYLAENGEIWDVWYDGPVNAWKKQKMNIDAGRAPYYTTDAPPASDAAANPAGLIAWNMVSGKITLEQHIAYPDRSGIIWDLWYDGGSAWHSRQINDGTTHAPGAIGNICLSHYSRVDTDGTVYGQLHCAWQDRVGGIWDAWHDLEPLPLGGPGGRG